jgi:apolipoprotein N-acyltransferase
MIFDQDKLEKQMVGQNEKVRPFLKACARFLTFVGFCLTLFSVFLYWIFPSLGLDAGTEEPWWHKFLFPAVFLSATFLSLAYLMFVSREKDLP